MDPDGVKITGWALAGAAFYMAIVGKPLSQENGLTSADIVNNPVVKEAQLFNSDGELTFTADVNGEKECVSHLDSHLDMKEDFLGGANVSLKCSDKDGNQISGYVYIAKLDAIRKTYGSSYSIRQN